MKQWPDTIEKLGWKAQSKLSPANRKSELSISEIKQYKPKTASVMLLLYPKGEQWFFPLIQRPQYKGVHSQQISLPGGKKEKEDHNDLATAIRETNEEIGSSLNDEQIYYALSELYIPPSNFIVHPFIGISNKDFTFVPEQKEVEKIYEVSLNDLLNADIQEEYSDKVRIPYFLLNQQKVWGATAMILNEAREIINSLTLQN